MSEQPEVREIRIDTNTAAGALKKNYMPGVSGYYWYQHPGRRAEIVQVVFDEGNWTFAVMTPDVRENTEFFDERNCWFGPIHVPHIIGFWHPPEPVHP